MKIAFDAKRMLNNATGLGNHSRILANALMKEYPKHEYLFFSPGEQERLRRELHGEYRIIPPTTPVSRLFHPWWRSYGVTEELLTNMVDIYHGLSNELPLNIHLSGIPSVVTIHDLIFLRHREQYPWIDRQVYAYKTAYAVEHAHKVIAVSEETKRGLIEMYRVPEDKIAVIYQSIDDRFSHQVSADDQKAIRSKYNLPAKFILNVGSFFPRKNQLRLIDAFDMIRHEIDYDLILVGSAGDRREEITRHIAAKNLQVRVQIIDSVTNDDMPTLYQCAGLFVFPSLFEGFGIPLLEALVSGVPVIATHGGAIEEAAGPGSVLIDPYHAGDIADKMRMVLKDQVLQAKMIAEGYRHAQILTSQNFAKMTMDIYREVLQA